MYFVYIIFWDNEDYMLKFLVEIKRIIFILLVKLFVCFWEIIMFNIFKVL